MPENDCFSVRIAKVGLALPNAPRECAKTTLKDMQLDERIREEALNIDQFISIVEAIRGTARN